MSPGLLQPQQRQIVKAQPSPAQPLQITHYPPSPEQLFHPILTAYTAHLTHEQKTEKEGCQHSLHLDVMTVTQRVSTEVCAHSCTFFVDHVLAQCASWSPQHHGELACICINCTAGCECINCVAASTADGCIPGYIA